MTSDSTNWVSFAGQSEYLPKDGKQINVNGKRVAQKGYITDELIDYALDWIDSIVRDGDEDDLESYKN